MYNSELGSHWDNFFFSFASSFSLFGISRWLFPYVSSKSVWISVDLRNSSDFRYRISIWGLDSALIAIITMVSGNPPTLPFVAIAEDGWATIWITCLAMTIAMATLAMAMVAMEAMAMARATFAMGVTLAMAMVAMEATATPMVAMEAMEATPKNAMEDREVPPMVAKEAMATQWRQWPPMLARRPKRRKKARDEWKWQCQWQ